MKRGLCLISTGIDSPVAAHMMIKKGWGLDFVHFAHSEASIPLVKAQVQRLAPEAKLFVVRQNFMAELKGVVNPRYTCLICKRLMYRIAEQIAAAKDYQALITGENLGQVASQTLDNLTVLSSSIKLPVLQPLLAFDKNETIALAREIGTYEGSIMLQGKCPYLPVNPSTRARLEAVEQEEGKLDIVGIVEGAVSSMVMSPAGGGKGI